MNKRPVEHCCDEMRNHIESDELHFAYLPKFREYGIEYADGGNSLQVIRYCPWCGASLPKSLRNEWFDEVDELGLDEDGPLPPALTTEEWWRDKKI